MTRTTKRKKAYNKGKKLFWWCKYHLKCYDDWGKWTECRYPFSGWNEDICKFRKLTKQKNCPHFQKGTDCCYLSKKEIERY